MRVWPWDGQPLVDESVPAMPRRAPPRYLRDEQRIVYEDLDPFGYEPLDRGAETMAEQARRAALMPPALALGIATLEAQMQGMEPSSAPMPTLDELRSARPTQGESLAIAPALGNAEAAPASTALAAGAPAAAATRAAELPAELRELEPELIDLDAAAQLLAARSSLAAFDAACVVRARALTNPAEKLGTGPFLSRAALKLAELDARTLFVLSTPFERDYDTGVVTAEPDGELQFADLCGGPGGWAEYLLWRRGPRCAALQPAPARAAAACCAGRLGGVPALCCARPLCRPGCALRRRLCPPPDAPARQARAPALATSADVNLQ